jgi:hypothetical protein
VALPVVACDCVVKDDRGRIPQTRVIGTMASILAAPNLAQYDGGKRVPATIIAIADAIRWAEEIMKEIDNRWPMRNEKVG